MPMGASEVTHVTDMGRLVAAPGGSWKCVAMWGCRTDIVKSHFLSSGDARNLDFSMWAASKKT